jgi:predicted Zn-dependent peptidase
MFSFSREWRLGGLGCLVLIGMLAGLSAPVMAQNSYKDLTYPPLRNIRVPDVDRTELPNGLVLYLLEDHTLPKIQGAAFIRTGDWYEPADKIGLASIVGQVMRTGGTTTRSGDEINRALENVGAGVETGIGGGSGSASLFTLKENLPIVLEIFADILQNPAFPEDKIQLAKIRMRTGIARRNDNVLGIASREFIKLLYGADSPYARTTEYATIDNIAREDLVDFHRRYFHPNQITLGLWGDFESSEVKSQVETLLGSWERTEAQMPPVPKVSASQQESVNFIPKDDVNQTNLRLGHLGGRRDHPDYFALQMMAEVLGGSMSSRLFTRIRSELGLAYAVSASWSAGWDHPGSFFIFCNTKSESTIQATEAILKEVRRITEEPISEQELAIAKGNVLNSFVFNFDSTGEIVGRLMTYEYYGYPKDFLEEYRSNVEKVTVDDVLRVAKKHIHPDKLTILAVGRAEDFDQPLSTLGEVQTIDITIPPPPKPAAQPSEGR